MCISRPTRRPNHTTVTQWLGPKHCTYNNIDPAGDLLIARQENDGIERFAFHNIHGTNLGKGFQVATEIESIIELGINVMGMTEINKPWSAGNKWEYDLMMDTTFGHSRTAYAAAPASYDTDYQPGGSLLTVNGNATGRVKEQGQDKWGRFAWFTMRGGRDEGILVISAYRVCHKKSDNPGTNTAFMHQYEGLRASGITNPDPRQQLLKDIQALIETKRQDGFRPVVMMDANGDLNHHKEADGDLRRFVSEAHLVDHFHEKFPAPIRTYIYGTKRLDYIFVDPSLTQAISRIGYLGTHEGAFSDHTMAYVDFHSNLLFKGIIHRPMELHAREFRIEQRDKVEKFLEAVISELKNHRIKERVFRLAGAFRKYGETPRNNSDYQQLDREIKEIVLGTAKKVGRKKFGYMRSSQLTLCGRLLVIFNMILDCKIRRAPFSPALLRRAKSMDVDTSKFEAATPAGMRKEVHQRRKDLWEAQKNAEENRAEWLKTEAKERARATGDEEWEKGLKNMLRVAESRSTNRKITAVTKGRSRPLDRIQVPGHDWFYSKKANEIYRYTAGNFEAYPAAPDDTFYKHHTLKVLPKDAVQTLVRDNNGRYHITKILDWYYSFTTNKLYHNSGDGVEVYRHDNDDLFRPDRPSPVPIDAMTALVSAIDLGEYVLDEVLQIPAEVWSDVTSQTTIETGLLERNKRHLQQTEIEGGTNTGPVMSELKKDMGLSHATDLLLDGEFTTDHTVGEAMAAWFKRVKQTDKEKGTPPIVGVITKEQFQYAFKVSTESTSSSPSGYIPILSGTGFDTAVTNHS